MSNFYSSGIYLNALAQVYFPGLKYSIEDFKLDGKIYRLLVINGKKIITSFPFMDYLENTNPSSKTTGYIDYLPKAVLDTLAYDPKNHQEMLSIREKKELAPFIKWHDFPSFEKFEEMMYLRNPKIITDTRRRRDKLTREKGRISFVFDNPSPDAIASCVEWKSGHYDDIGGTDMFLNKNHAKMFKELQLRKLVIVSSLQVNNKQIAVHIGAYWNKIFYYWIPAYDRSYSSYAPGRLLLHFLLKETYTRKSKMFDFLSGAEDYKWNYATGYHIIGPLGKPSAVRNIMNLLVNMRSDFKSGFPALYYWIKRYIIYFKKVVLNK